MKPVLLSETLEGLAGQWVALRGGDVVAAKESADALRVHLHDRDITGVTMMRVPDKDEPELVGFG